MGTNKRITLWSAIISVISFVIAVFVDTDKHTLLYDLSLGLFTGSILACITALICYFRDKRLLLFQTIDELNKIYRLMIRFKPYRKKYAASSLDALKTVLEINLNSLNTLVHEYDAFSMTDITKFRSAYNCLTNLRDKHLGVIQSTWAMIEMGCDEEMIQQNYASIEKDIILWVPFEDGIGRHGKNLITEKIQENIDWLIALHNKKYKINECLCKIMERVKKILKKKIPAVIISGVLLSVVYFWLDIFNIPSRMGIDISSVNWDSTALILGNIIVIGLFLVTYFLLDKRSVEKENNQREVAELVLKLTYDRCEETIKLFDNPKTTELAAKKCNRNALEFQDSVLQAYLNLPFEHTDMINDFVNSGVIAADEYENYLTIRKLYQSHIRVKLIFDDREEFQQYKREDLNKAIADGRKMVTQHDRR